MTGVTRPLSSGVNYCLVKATSFSLTTASPQFVHRFRRGGGAIPGGPVPVRLKEFD
jgi:hypothetical protein